MLTRRRVLVFGIPGAFVAGLVITWLLWPRTAITADNAAKVREGMTLAEVEALLGPARDESTGPLAAELTEAIDDPDEREFRERFHVVLRTRELWGGPLDSE